MNYRLFYQGVHLGEVNNPEALSSKRSSGDFQAIRPLPERVQAYLEDSLKADSFRHDDAAYDRFEEEHEAR